MNTQIDLEQFRLAVAAFKVVATQAKQSDAIAEANRLLSIIDSAKVAHEIIKVEVNGEIIDEAMVERATRAFMETHRPELEHSIRAALAAALPSAPGM